MKYFYLELRELPVENDFNLLIHPNQDISIDKLLSEIPGVELKTTFSEEEKQERINKAFDFYVAIKSLQQLTNKPVRYTDIPSYQKENEERLMIYRFEDHSYIYKSSFGFVRGLPLIRAFEDTCNKIIRKHVGNYGAEGFRIFCKVTGETLASDPYMKW